MINLIKQHLSSNTGFREWTWEKTREEEEEKKRKKGEMLESEVNANDSRYLNDGIYTGRLHGDDLQPNRPICLGYSIYAFL